MALYKEIQIFFISVKNYTLLDKNFTYYISKVIKLTFSAWHKENNKFIYEQINKNFFYRKLRPSFTKIMAV